MKVKDIQKEIAEILIFIADYYPDMEGEDNTEIKFKLYDLVDKI